MSTWINSFNTQERDCGWPVEGGYYACADFSPFGSLRPWTWCPGSGIQGGKNLLISVPPRQLSIGHLGETLLSEILSPEEGPRFAAQQNDYPALRKFPSIALFDHVGQQYTPYSFAKETQRLGVSRHIPENIAVKLAAARQRMSCIPIVFTHNHIPVTVQAEELLEWAAQITGCNPYMVNWTSVPPFMDKEWGCTVSSRYYGENHWLIPVLKAMDAKELKDERDLTRIMPHFIAEETLLLEGVFGVSWITEIRYIMKADEGEDTAFGQRQRGIKPGRVNKVEEEE